jgi:crotonobetainyl-CoA:carnitine CoA-transferase CaiB-like acyl-CoA transferase
LIDLSQFEALSTLLETLVLALSVNPSGQAVQRSGNRLPHGGGTPHGAYRCEGEDRWVAISVFKDAEWDAFTNVISNPPWTKDARFNSTLVRQQHADQLDELVESWTLQYTPEEIMHRLQSVGVAAGVVQSGADLAEDPQLKGRGFFRQVPDAQNGLRTIEGAPYHLFRTPGGAVREAPELGADQTYLLRDILGMSDDELADCAIAGVFD